MNLDQLQGKNYYEILGVERDADVVRIKEVYRDIARAYHPDSNFYSEIVPGKAGQEQVEVFKIITAAYNTLTDQSKRLEYDRMLEQLTVNLKSWETTDDFWGDTGIKAPPRSKKESSPRPDSAVHPNQDWGERSREGKHVRALIFALPVVIGAAICLWLIFG